MPRVAVCWWRREDGEQRWAAGARGQGDGLPARPHILRFAIGPARRRTSTAAASTVVLLPVAIIYYLLSCSRVRAKCYRSYVVNVETTSRKHHLIEHASCRLRPRELKQRLRQQPYVAALVASHEPRNRAEISASFEGDAQEEAEVRERH